MSIVVQYGSIFVVIVGGTVLVMWVRERRGGGRR